MYVYHWPVRSVQEPLDPDAERFWHRALPGTRLTVKRWWRLVIAVYIEPWQGKESSRGGIVYERPVSLLFGVTGRRKGKTCLTGLVLTDLWEKSFFVGLVFVFFCRYHLLAGLIAAGLMHLLLSFACRRKDQEMIQQLALLATSEEE